MLFLQPQAKQGLDTRGDLKEMAGTDAQGITNTILLQTQDMTCHGLALSSFP